MNESYRSELPGATKKQLARRRKQKNLRKSPILPIIRKPNLKGFRSHPKPHQRRRLPTPRRKLSQYQNQNRNRNQNQHLNLKSRLKN